MNGLLAPIPESFAALVAQLPTEVRSGDWTLVVADETGTWADLVAALGRRERARTVLVSDRASDLVEGVRLGLGGSAWLPLSTRALADGVAAAREAGRRCVPQITDSGVISRRLRGEPVRELRWTSSFWSCWLGECGVADVLSRAADALGRPPLVAEGPTLKLAGDVDGSEVDAAVAAALAECPEVPGWALGSEMAECWQGADVEAAPVAEVPSGRHVGWWAFSSQATAAGRTMVVDRSPQGELLRWSSWPGGPRVCEVATPSAVPDSEADVLRMPRWMSLRLAPGSPECRLGHAMAREAATVGKPLWIPGIAADSLACVLQWPGIMWVDGPAVPPEIVDSARSVAYDPSDAGL